MTGTTPRDTVSAVTELILEVFRLNGALLAAGDRLVSGLSLTSARWQVLGAIDASPVALPISHVARNMGLTRQAVQRLANEMAKDGLVAFEENPHHSRAKLIVMTTHGRQVYAAAMKLQRKWATQLARGVETVELARATATLGRLRSRLER